MKVKVATRDLYSFDKTKSLALEEHTLRRACRSWSILGRFQGVVAS